jgi:glucosamine--fructose-6-phosphate aminotransferase (isomerizing)
MNGYITFAEARETQAGELGLAIPRIADQIRQRQADGEFAGPGPIFVGIGASLAAACPAVWALRSRGIHSWRLGAGDLPVPFPESVHPIVGISQSGRSAETLAVLDSVAPDLRLAVVNTEPSPIAQVASTVALGNLADSYASTLGYTATVAALGMIADAWDGGEIDPGWFTLHETFARVERGLTDRVRSLAELFRTVASSDFVGAGPAVGSAEAGALLFREVARIPATGMSTRQYLHGSMESAGDGVHVVFGDSRELDLATTLSEAGHHVILISAEPVDASPTLHVVQLPKLPTAQRAVLEALVMQMLVGAVAEVRGVEIEEFVFHNADTKVPVDAGAAGGAA